MKNTIIKYKYQNVCPRLEKSGLTYFSFSLKTNNNITLSLGLKTNNLMFNNINLNHLFIAILYRDFTVGTSI